MINIYCSLLLLATLVTVSKGASLLGVRLGAGVIESYQIDSSTGETTALANPSVGISGGWSDGMFAMDRRNGVHYIATDPSGTGGANLYGIDSSNGSVLSSTTMTGAAPSRIDAMEVLSDGSIIGVRTRYGATNYMDTYHINPITGVASALSTPSFTLAGSWGDGMFSVDEANDRYYVMTTKSGESATLHSLELSSGDLLSATNLIGAVPLRIDAIQILADGTLLAIDQGSSAFDTYSIDTATGTATAYTNSSFPAAGGWAEGMMAVSEGDGEFYFTTDPSGSGSASLFTMDLDDGSQTSSISLTGTDAPIRIDAFALADPIPEPTTLLSLIVGLGSLVLRRQRR
ncbi:MAG: PEP-CTERM sorting domain-containing protein [Akkermansiaceae bacterium]